ncbi:helix-turn-helix domain-containing protein [Parasedimentitalea maritima]|uniref:Helix-turn-helix domain-containing protein n=1 Tax=Parasedimentitalea maritima TaxID=2578117 RepID=A0A6A4RGM0_9RHOB|nr:helix-turn-helix transcriptional regulator [Zongyanglinia marina]KAE9627971.1 helix-turn-helix domain-containing protein [Zongyanglinia marina]
MKLRERVGLNIQNMRRSKGLSQENLALAAEIDRSYLSEIELAKFSVSVDILERLANVLDVDPQEIFDKRD